MTCSFMVSKVFKTFSSGVIMVSVSIDTWFGFLNKFGVSSRFSFPLLLWNQKTFQHSNSAKFKLPTTSYKKGYKAKPQKHDHLGFTLVSHHLKTRTIYIIIKEANFSSYSLYKEANQKCSKLSPSIFCPDS